MNAHYDVSCKKCRRRYGWFGRVSQQPKCPKCGFRPSQIELDKAEKDFEKQVFGDQIVLECIDALPACTKELSLGFKEAFELAKECIGAQYKNLIIKIALRLARNENRLNQGVPA